MSSKQKQIDSDVKEYKKARMLPQMHLLTTSSQMNNITPNVILDALGLNPVIEMLGQATQNVIKENLS